MSSEKKPVSLLGTTVFGGRADAEQSRDMVQAFLDRGHNQLDTAYMYMDGKSETIIGGMNLPKTGIAEDMLGFVANTLTVTNGSSYELWVTAPRANWQKQHLFSHF